jgi:cellulose synthase/poly-beta-1,6-N-acetylglucosamine synthase-like glycosyltransferase
MIVQILANLHQEGYLDRARHPTIAPFFAGANVAFRRTALERIGGYDPGCVTGEDCDVCARLLTAGWELYLRRGAVVQHRNPSRIRDLTRRWFGYGRYHPYVFAKHNDRAVECYVRFPAPGGTRYTCLFYRPFPFAVVIFLTKFLFLHLSLAGTALMWLAGLTGPAWAGLALSLGLLAAYVWPDVRRHGPALGTAYAALRYCADTALFVGALIGGFSQRMLYLSATVD